LTFVEPLAASGVVVVPSLNVMVVALAVAHVRSNEVPAPAAAFKLQVGAAGTGEPGVKMMDLEHEPPGPMAFRV
jgi:hypothetical protein